MNVIKSNCLLCGRKLWPASSDYARTNGFQIHPNAANKANGCLVKFTDRFGVAIEEEDLEDPSQPQGSDDDFLSELAVPVTVYPTVDSVMHKAFAEHNVPRLGGASTGRGWSSFGVYQRCPYLWKRKYDRPTVYVSTSTPSYKESPALAIGSIIHALLAIWYLRTIKPDYPLTPETFRDRMRSEADPALVDEGYRVFYLYTFLYQHDPIQTLAVEYNLRDPRTNESCRFDLVGFYAEAIEGRPAGTYIVEHKSSGRFDDFFVNGWGNDGEVLGQVMLWKRLGLDKRFGELQGVIMNLCGTQKEPQFHRTLVAPTSFQLEQHKEDLRRWEGLIQLSRANNSWPRARNNCANRFGTCQEFNHCSSGES